MKVDTEYQYIYFIATSTPIPGSPSLHFEHYREVYPSGLNHCAFARIRVLWPEVALRCFVAKVTSLNNPSACQHNFPQIVITFCLFVKDRDIFKVFLQML